MGRRPTGKLPAQPLLYIAEKHREIARRKIAGESQHKISVELGISESRLSIICNSPVYQEMEAQMRQKVEEKYIDNVANVKGRIEALQEKAVDVLESIVSQTQTEDGTVIPLRLRKETALNILEIAGNGKKTGEEKKDTAGDVINMIKEGYKLAMSQVRERELIEKAKEEPKNITPIDIKPEIQSNSNILPERCEATA